MRCYWVPPRCPAVLGSMPSSETSSTRSRSPVRDWQRQEAIARAERASARARRWSGTESDGKGGKSDGKGKGGKSHERESDDGKGGKSDGEGKGGESHERESDGKGKHNDKGGKGVSKGKSDDKGKGGKRDGTDLKGKGGNPFMRLINRIRVEQEELALVEGRLRSLSGVLRGSQEELELVEQGILELQQHIVQMCMDGCEVVE